jgi:hypothetical protein
VICSRVCLGSKVKVELYLHRLLPIVSILAALGPGLSVWKMLRDSAAAKTITQYWPLPEIHIPTIDFITLAIATMLCIAALLLGAAVLTYCRFYRRAQ